LYETYAVDESALENVAVRVGGNALAGIAKGLVHGLSRSMLDVVKVPGLGDELVLLGALCAFLCHFK